MCSCQHCGCLERPCSCTSSAPAVPLGFPTTHHSATKTYIAPCTSFVNIIMWVCYFSQSCATAIKVYKWDTLPLSLLYTLDNNIQNWYMWVQMSTCTTCIAVIVWNRVKRNQQWKYEIIYYHNDIYMWVQMSTMSCWPLSRNQSFYRQIASYVRGVGDPIAMVGQW